MNLIILPLLLPRWELLPVAALTNLINALSIAISDHDLIAAIALAFKAEE